MRKSIALVLLLAAVLFAGNRSAAQEFFYDLETAYVVEPSASRIGIQFDTTYVGLNNAQFFDTHPCLDDTVSITYLDRGFWTYGIRRAPSCSYAVTAAGLLSDPSVHRVVPIYVGSDSSEFKVTDLIDVQFEDNITSDSMQAILRMFGVHFVEADTFAYNLWVCALDDTIRTSPLAAGNSLHTLPGVRWVCAQQYTEFVPASVPTDPYYQHQSYLKNIGQDGGIPGVDINIEPAWNIPLVSPQLNVAILDDGITVHADLPASRIVRGYDFSGDFLSKDYHPDTIPRPGFYQNHGMACAGILAASHNEVGIAGVFGTCIIVPIKISDNDGFPTSTFHISQAIRWAGEKARVISMSWTSLTSNPDVSVANAIRDVVIGRRIGIPKNGDDNFDGSSVMIVPAGNVNSKGDTLKFPAYMPEVIAVGAIGRWNDRQPYSCYGPELDVVAPSGNETVLDPMWTIDQTADTGWNPTPFSSYGDTPDHDYTKLMSGTSGACPQVAGIAALLLARGHDSISYRNPTLKIREIITRTADSLGSARWNQYTGYGRANAYRAMLSIIHGDINNDAKYNVLDVNLAVDVVFRGGHATLDNRTVDVNCDGVRNVLDIVRLINYVSRGGPPPVICFRY